MSLTAGTRFGPYEILSLIGSGGMGEVYRAKDSKLGRDVALKILPDAFTHDPERLARFRREAQTLAALNHPHIGAIYGLDDAEGQQFLVLELVDGESLDRRIARGAIPVAEALAIAKQVAEALEAAHERGIIHRDLKPANIALNSDGIVKVLDFGLAKATDAQVQASSELANSPTITSPAMMTGIGVILGTAAYMSPEQARGRSADKRSDVWAFGCVLYEMLTGQQAFDGEDVGETLAAVIRGEPDWRALPVGLSPIIATLLKRTLEKDRQQRIGDASTAKFLLTEASAPGLAPVVGAASGGLALRTKWMLGALVAVAMVAIMVAGWLLARTPPTQIARAVTRFRVSLPPDATFYFGTNPQTSIAISPDGTRLVFAARIGSKAPQLYLRTIDQLDAVPIRGADGGLIPFFSPDGQSLAFFRQEGSLRRVPIGGGTPAVICETQVRGATWLPDDTIVFAPGNGPLRRVPAGGGQPVDVTKLDSTTETSHSWPYALPGGHAIVFSIQRPNTDFNGAAIGLLNLDTGQQRVLIEGGSMPQYMPSGHLVFHRAGSVLAVPFDLRTLQVRGTAVPVLDGVLTNAGGGSAQLAISATGTMAYVAGSEVLQSRSLAWVDRRGVVQSVPAPRQYYEGPRLSPDGTRVALSITGSGSTALRDVWLYDLPRGTLSRLTFEKEEAESPIWTPDGKRLVYAVLRAGQRQLVWRSADGSGGEELLLTNEHHLHTASWTPDGTSLLSVVPNGPDVGSFWMLQMTPPRALRVFLKTQAQLQAPTISPDGRWLAYASNETSRFEIYIQAFPGPGARFQVSTTGGTEPRWARNGQELFYRDGDKMMAAAVITKGAGLDTGSARVLFEGRFASVGGSNLDAYYDVSPDGQRFLMIKSDETPGATGVVVVQDWTNELKARVPAR